MGFTATPISSPCNAFVAHLTELMQSTEIRKRRRTAAAQARFEEGFGTILAHLLLAASVHPRKWSYRETAAGGFSGAAVGYDTFTKIMAFLECDRFVERHRGGNLAHHFADGTDQFVPGLATRFRGTSALVELAETFGVDLRDVRAHVSDAMPRDVIRLRAGSTMVNGIKQRGRSLPVTDCETSVALAGQIHKLNDFLAGFEFEGCDFGGFFRRFNMADQPGFAFNKGGRLYCDDGDSYQQMKKAERLALMINGSSVVEIDINASYLTILHSLKQAPLPDRADIYDIPGLDRRIAKAWLTATLGHDKFHLRWPPKTVAQFREEGMETSAIPTMKTVGAMMLEAFPVLQDWDQGGVSWADLMFLESEAVLQTMLTLMDQGIPGLPVHDSLIVRNTDETVATEALTSAFGEVVGISPRLKVNRPS